jgi:hypothetical protein
MFLTKVRIWAKVLGCCVAFREEVMLVGISNMLFSTLTGGLFGSTSRRRRPEVNGGRFAFGQGCETLEERRVPSAVAIANATDVAPEDASAKGARSVPKQAINETIDTPVGPLEITARLVGKHLKGKAQLTLNLPENIPFDLPPLRFNISLTSNQLKGRFVIRYDDLKPGGRVHRIVGKVVAAEDPNNTDNFAGHVTLKIDGKTLVDTDFSIPKSSLGGLFNPV